MKQKISVGIISLLILALLILSCPDIISAETEGLGSYALDFETLYIENDYTNAEPLNLGDKIQVGNMQLLQLPPLKSIIYNADMKYKITIKTPSIVTIKLSTEANLLQDRANGERPNVLNLSLYEADFSHIVSANEPVDDDYNAIQVTGDGRFENEFVYKLLPGTYFAKVTCEGAINAFGWVSLASMTPTTNDTLEEPNDNATSSKTKKIDFGVKYVGLIRYNGAKDGAGFKDYGDDMDCFRLEIPDNNMSIRLNASRADKERNNNIILYLKDSNDYSISDRLSLYLDPEGSIECTGLKQGTYYVYIDGQYANTHPTEYSFSVDDLTKCIKTVENLYMTKGSSITLPYAEYPVEKLAKPVTITSSKPSTVSVKGAVLTAKAEGTATLTLKDSDGITTTCIVTVVPKKVAIFDEAFTPDAKNLTLYKGTYKRITYEISPSNCTNIVPAFKSSDSSIVSVDKMGLITAKAPGTAKVSITIGTKSKTYTVTVIDVP